MSEPFIAQITQFGGNFAPRGWSLCQGQLLPISQYQALFSLVGTIYGGDGRTTFGLPDMRGRVSMHYGSGPGLSTYRIGQKAGVENSTVPVVAHTHALKGTGAEVRVACHKGAGGDGSVEGNYSATSTEDIYSDTTDGVMGASTDIRGNTASAGVSNATMDVRQPSLAVTWLIALTGVYPSRN